MKINPSEHLTEQMSLKDTTVYDKLKADNWEEWEQNTLNLLDTRHLREYTEVNYGLAIERAQQYRRLRQQEVLNFAAPSLSLSASSGKDSVSTSEGEKAAAALQKTSCKAKDLQATLNLLLSVKADGVGEQIQRLESKLAAMKERISQLKDLDSVDHGQLSTAKINAQIYPGKTEAEIKAHLESVHELEIGATHTHALLSASVSKGLKSYVQAVTKGKPNPYVLWHALKDRFHNKSLNLQANLQRFNVA